jgi:hypothetical protein
MTSDLHARWPLLRTLVLAFLLHLPEAAIAMGKGQEPEAGRWRMARSAPEDATLSAEQRAQIEQLEAIGYLTGSRAAGGTGVGRHDAYRAHEGLNFYTSGHAPEAILMDMNGRVLHRWRRSFDELWPGRQVEKRSNSEFWRRAYLYENGDVLAIFEGMGLVKVDRNSKTIWKNELGAHHDLEIAENGDIYVLERRAHIVPRISESEPVLEDYLTILAADGSIKRSISLLEAFERSEFRSIMDRAKRKTGDIFHTNSVDMLDGSIEAKYPIFAKGRLLTSMNSLQTLAVVDLAEEKVVWARRVRYAGLHDPRILPNGNLLLFENRKELRASRVVELLPMGTGAIWDYSSSSEDPFYSRSCGIAQRLDNGNTLITESDNGRAIEVTADGQVVWEFFNPHRGGEGNQYIATLFELRRLPLDFPLGWLEPASSRSPSAK